MNRRFHEAMMKKGLRALILFAIVARLAPSVLAQKAPPWSKGANDPTVDKGYVFQVDDVDNVPDLHGNPSGARLVLFIGGNQFFVLPQLIAGFEKQHPRLAGHIYYETLPPGILRQQMAHANALTLGNLTVQAQPDVYEAGARVLAAMERKGIVEKPVSYATNDLEIMIHAGNPKHIRSLRDLARPDVEVSMPNPKWEGVSRQIGNSLRKAGGEALYQSVYMAKVQSGGTYLTRIHHRQTPMRIIEGASDAGVTWASEVEFQQKIGNPITGVRIPASWNTMAIYAAGVLRQAPHPKAARAWVNYLRTSEAQAIYHQYGFKSIQ
jgi:ABC-type molybdate transport system substrate-binding protein